MRRLVLAAMMIGTVTGAQAADLPDFPILRGSYVDAPSRSGNWEGWYVGGQIGYTSGDIDFSHAPSAMTSFMLRESVLADPVSGWALLPKNHAQSNGFGAFVGRNWQWDDVVLGVEANYNYLNGLESSAGDSMTRQIVNPKGETPPSGHTYTYNTTLSGSAALQVKDVTTFRGRAGWAAGNFLPYMFGGVAVGRMSVSRSATVSFDKYDAWAETQTVGNNTVTIQHNDYLGSGSAAQTEQRVNNYAVGWTAGLGLEYCVVGGLFLRGEWEYVRFAAVKNIAVDMNSFRVGAGYKF
ncbi:MULTISPECIES: outer membrane protein [Bradyrhizobium]|uniref:outer membrane protein n=1 Tax=Bradyrhizobium TaxID=374 RepID=UPI001CD55324|nr:MULTISPECIES: outer membrane beta-barrel protein [Bradyrhizobium]